MTTGKIRALVEIDELSGANCRLNVLVTGPTDGQPVVVVHGMRDHAYSMLYLSEHLPDCRLILPHLRGHGDSEKPGYYGMLLFIADLKAVFDHYGLVDVVLVGHSLGGHICGRFTALYPSLVTRLIMLDGMGPPGEADTGEKSIEWRFERWRASIEQQLSMYRRRTMISETEAVDRLMANNPALSLQRAELLTRHGVEQTEDGVVWKWDARVDSIWTTFSHSESEEAYQAISCPVLLVTGSRSIKYWASIRSNLDQQDTEFYETDQLRKKALFQHADWIEINQAGHMLHYDQPNEVAKVIRNFIPDKSP